MLRSIASTTLLIIAGCSPNGGKSNVLDAAAIYEANRRAIADIILAYPGPVTDFMRIPARDPAKETVEERQFIEQLRKDFPVEFIDFFPRSDSGMDEVDVVINRYSINTDWNVVSLVYVSIPLSKPDAGSNMALFDKCDQRSLDWLEADHGPGPVSVFCQVDEFWYAHQKVG